MKNKFFWLYLAGGLLALGLLIRDVIAAYPQMPGWSDNVLYVLSGILFFYLAFKTYHEKKDKEMM
jgi:hypothetical protein